MRDLKHITRRKRLSFSSLCGNKKIRQANSFKSLKESAEKQNRLRFVLPVIAFALAAYPVSFLVSSLYAAKWRLPALTGKKSPARKRLELDASQSFQVAVASLPYAGSVGGRLVASLHDGGSVLYTIDQQVQQKVENVMAQYQLPYSVFVAIEPRTGRILALAGHSTANPAWAGNSYFNVYPMASLFKIITASAALEQKKITPDTVFPFRGSLYSENPEYWSVRHGRSSQQVSLSLAMGKSINPVFGRLASDVVGKESIMTYVDKFGFNQTLFPGIPVTPSRAASPNNDDELRLMGAGLGREVKISPLHVAAIIAAIANDGVMMEPILAQQIKNGAGKVIYNQSPRPVRRLVTSGTACQLEKMLSTTVNSGTSRKVFHDRRGRPKLASVNVCAKTGTINGKDPAGTYTWFAAFAPAQDPMIAVVALVINQDRWRIKASYLGEQALEAFFK
jgi:peptidoglycan glycosyltransferase